MARAGGGAPLLCGLRGALLPQRRGEQRIDRGRGPGVCETDPAAPLPGGVRVRAAAGPASARSDRAAGAHAVPRHELRTERVGGVSAASVLAAAPGAGVRAGVGREGGASAGGHAAGAWAGFPDLVQAAGSGDRSVPGAGATGARGRDLVGGAGAGGGRAEPALLAVGLPDRGRRAVPGGSVAECRGGRGTVRQAGAAREGGVGV